MWYCCVRSQCIRMNIVKIYVYNLASVFHANFQLTCGYIHIQVSISRMYAPLFHIIANLDWKIHTQRAVFIRLAKYKHAQGAFTNLPAWILHESLLWSEHRLTAKIECLFACMLCVFAYIYIYTLFSVCAFALLQVYCMSERNESTMHWSSSFGEVHLLYFNATLKQSQTYCNNCSSGLHFT